ncbi:MAG TPA: hypothetical protein VFU10_12310 [Gaiellaceae bacterium]|nr:hypothetical protein [Gaiellaceae bacterium]
MRIAVVVGLLVLALVPAAGTADGLPQLVATDGPGFTIDLTDANGKHVDTLVAGQYQLLVHDMSDIHNWALGSQTQNVRILQTDVPFVGDQTFTVDLTPGRYAYACSAHPFDMNGVFVVVPPTVVTKSLSAKVDARTATMSVNRTAAGSYRITVHDTSKTRNFHLVGPGVNRHTTKAFKGTVTWTLDLSAGTYKFGSDPRLTGRLTVS